MEYIFLDDWKHHFYLGQNLKSGGRTDEASKEFQTSVEIQANAGNFDMFFLTKSKVNFIIILKL